MMLTSLLESRSTNTNFVWQVIGYWIHKSCARLVLGFSPLSLVPVTLVFSTAFYLATITNVKIAKIDTSFLTLDFTTETICWWNSPYFCNESIWCGKYLFFLFGDWCWYLLQKSLNFVLVLVYHNVKDFFSSSGFFSDR